MLQTFNICKRMNLWYNNSEQIIDLYEGIAIATLLQLHISSEKDCILGEGEAMLKCSSPLSVLFLCLLVAGVTWVKSVNCNRKNYCYANCQNLAFEDVKILQQSLNQIFRNFSFFPLTNKTVFVLVTLCICLSLSRNCRRKFFINRDKCVKQIAVRVN